MPVRQLIIRATLLFLIMVPGLQAANGIIATNLPAQPGQPLVTGSPAAWSPFRLEFPVTGRAAAMPNHSLAIVLNGHQLRLEYSAEGEAEPLAYRFATEIQGLAPGSYRVDIARRMPNGDLVLETEGSFSISSAPPSLPAYAFFHPQINHYFVTADPVERDLVLADGWYSADDGFRVWPAQGPAPAAAHPVCRFYSALVNSHFYTASASECDLLQSPSSGWTYEGIAFQALMPTDQACPSGTQAVWRLYNHGAAELDSNHRFVTSRDVYESFHSYWAGEGVAFCSPTEG